MAAAVRCSALRRWVGALASAVLMCTVLIPADAEAEAGRVNFAYGDVRIVDAAGNEREVRRGTLVDEGDTIRTGRRSAAQLRMVDGAALAVRAQTEIRIAQYSFSNDAREDRSFLSLVRGTMRAITGLIGRSNRDSYRIRTATATIGIRGSDGDVGFNPTTGLVGVRTNVGGHSLSTDVPGGTGDTIETNPGQIATALPGQPPGLSDVFPFEVPIRAARARRARNQQSTDDEQADNAGDGDGNATDGAASDGDGEFAFEAFDPGDIDGFEGEDGFGEFEGFDFDDFGDFEEFLESIGALDALELAETELVRTSNDSIGVLPVGFFAVGAFIQDESRSVVPSVGNFAVGEGFGFIETNAFGEVIFIFEDDSFGAFEFDADGAILGFSGDADIRNASGEVVGFAVFGYWESDFAVLDDDLPVVALSEFHFALANNLTSLSALQSLDGVFFDYFFLDGIATNEAGAEPVFLDAFMSGQFRNDATLGPISVGILADFPVGSTGWTLGGSGTIAAFMSNDGIPLGGSCCSSAAPIAAAGDITGRFVGTDAEGVVAGFSATAGATKFIAGTIVAER